VCRQPPPIATAATINKKLENFMRRSFSLKEGRKVPNLRRRVKRKQLGKFTPFPQLCPR
jgi:hypothetical protein